MTEFTLTKENYHTPEANRRYMSVSQYKRFLKCEARAKAMLDGTWTEEESEALMIGKYVHAGIEGSLEKFKILNPALFTQKGTLRAEFKLADLMVKTILSDPFMQMMMIGEREKIVTATLWGVEWKTMWDVYNPEKRRIVDWKTTKSIFDKIWSDKFGGKVSFIEEYDYMIQAAVYAEAEMITGKHGGWPEFYIAAVSKENVPDKAIINMTDPDRWGKEIKDIIKRLPGILAVKEGRVAPERCEHCDYCRSTKKITSVLFHADLMA